MSELVENCMRFKLQSQSVIILYAYAKTLFYTKHKTEHAFIINLYSSQNVIDFQSLILKLKMLLILREKDTLIIKCNWFYKIRPYD